MSDIYRRRAEQIIHPRPTSNIYPLRTSTILIEHLPPSSNNFPRRTGATLVVQPIQPNKYLLNQPSRNRRKMIMSAACETLYTQNLNENMDPGS
ncbi:hypothetical protein CC1G_06982 [Coprinopsis cinerea okayama7|uniref:Uncharacterized protein n=1 Tax=Coprinopsis cinerea (strain Okayama-7 / 130 / ATCC MYA-4618 / FGSC 9003) TaxID=240176 RepID=A8NAS9_COPC7|nr:hypothetical protein CC1G_06982 [Coprinopsis cinerea okayama7\|eukprot:XP_001831931.1 hypothetical protein CC1G_06982 [Coprinopsis cinerea okayama7\